MASPAASYGLLGDVLYNQMLVRSSVKPPSKKVSKSQHAVSWQSLTALHVRSVCSAAGTHVLAVRKRWLAIFEQLSWRFRPGCKGLL